MANPPPADPQLDDQPLNSSLQRDSSTSRANEDNIPLESPELGNGTLSAETFNWDYNYGFSMWEIDVDFYADHSYKNSIEEKEGEASVNYADTPLGSIGTIVAPTLFTLHDFIEAQPRPIIPAPTDIFDFDSFRSFSSFESLESFDSFDSFDYLRPGLSPCYSRPPEVDLDEELEAQLDLYPADEDAAPVTPEGSIGYWVSESPPSHSCENCGQLFYGVHASARLARHRRTCRRASKPTHRPRLPYEKPLNIRERKKRRFRMPFGPKGADAHKPSDSNVPASSFEEELRRRGDEADRIAGLPLDERDAAQAIEDKRQQGVDIVGPNYYLHVD